MLPEVLKGVLRPAHKAYGLYLREHQVHMHLMLGNKTIAMWRTEAVTTQQIQEAADKIIEEE